VHSASSGLSSQLGGAIAPLLIVPIQMHFGWRASFFVFGIVGVVWAAGWWRWYRNRPEEKTGITDRKLAEIGPALEPLAHAFPWQAIGSNKSVWAIMGATSAYVYSVSFFFVLGSDLHDASAWVQRGGNEAVDAAVRAWGSRESDGWICAGCGNPQVGTEERPANHLSCRTRDRGRRCGARDSEQLRGRRLAGALLRRDHISAADGLGYLRRHREALCWRCRGLHEHSGKSWRCRVIANFRIHRTAVGELRRSSRVDGGRLARWRCPLVSNRSDRVFKDAER